MFAFCEILCSIAMIQLSLFLWKSTACFMAHTQEEFVESPLVHSEGKGSAAGWALQEEVRRCGLRGHDAAPRCSWSRSQSRSWQQLSLVTLFSFQDCIPTLQKRERRTRKGRQPGIWNTQKLSAKCCFHERRFNTLTEEISLLFFKVKVPSRISLGFSNI